MRAFFEQAADVLQEQAPKGAQLILGDFKELDLDNPGWTNRDFLMERRKGQELVLPGTVTQRK
eukprot:7223395-Alexandrium_andersonii.AAC.1